ncbi:hypothetical protein ZIOFF_052048 [Zingiber officinale]|uniref:Flavoprotein pyridine nucleotide cytochrome reductase-like FAD-binding domain-containing protein n=1 Tax=Zingiber officinale TaxID=94328 RepID=A0A8J5FMW1_ZINOF|nr:hypothetical protein ZIOFF_052048 [Zingiber officinale]
MQSLPSMVALAQRKMCFPTGAQSRIYIYIYICGRDGLLGDERALDRPELSLTDGSEVREVGRADVYGGVGDVARRDELADAARGDELAVVHYRRRNCLINYKIDSPPSLHLHHRRRPASPPLAHLSSSTCTSFVKDHLVLINAGDRGLIPSGDVYNASIHGASDFFHFTAIRDVRIYIPICARVGKHIFFYATIDGKLCMRAYTQTSPVDVVGHFELLVKMEGEGNVSHAKKEKEKTNDPVKLRMKVEKLDAKIDALKAKKEEIIKQLYDLEGAGS